MIPASCFPPVQRLDAPDDLRVGQVPAVPLQVDGVGQCLIFGLKALVMHRNIFDSRLLGRLKPGVAVNDRLALIPDNNRLGGVIAPSAHGFRDRRQYQGRGGKNLCKR